MKVWRLAARDKGAHLPLWVVQGEARVKIPWVLREAIDKWNDRENGMGFISSRRRVTEVDGDLCGHWGEEWWLPSEGHWGRCCLTTRRWAAGDDNAKQRRAESGGGAAV